MSVPVGLVIPVKRLGLAKTRLRVGDPAEHAELALALALDTIEAARAASTVGEIVVVSDEPRIALAGVRVVADPRAGLNAAFAHGAAHLPPGPRAALQADLPALKPAELDAALDAALSAPTRSFVADARGDGTTLLLAPAGVPLDPRFGPGSAAAHLASGARPIDGELPGLRRDVDTEEDLRAALGLGAGPRTRTQFCAFHPSRS